MTDHQPGQGGWTPPRWMPIVAAVFSGSAIAVGAVLTGGMGLTVPLIVGAALSGAGGGLAAYFGVRSAGPRQVPPPGAASSSGLSAVASKPPGEGLR